ncbi:EamA family transporter [Nocardiopsis sp. NPDC006139]|uniref:EamA family transporter n=1 Tax=Nocardiopsis sp. NPDC006139 TaxID=3154578 RepID=UPI0033BDC443
MRPFHLFLAVLVAAVWGVNFVVIEVGLDHFPPLLFTALRFLVAAVPAVFLVKRPRVALGWILVVGLTLGVAKFGLVFTGMHLGMPAGLTSLVLQVQAVFTAVFAVVFLGERLRPLRYAGMVVALGGIGVAAWAQGGSGPLAAFSMIIAAAAFWGLANVATRKAAPPDTLSWMVWVSLVPPLPLFALSLLVEGPEAGLAALRGLDLTGIGALLFIAWVATVFGFGVWGFLLREHDASAVAPFTLLVPVFGMLSAWVFLGEEVTPLNLLAAVLLVGGVALTALGGGRSRAGGRDPGEERGNGPEEGVSGGRTPGRVPSAAPDR